MARHLVTISLDEKGALAVSNASQGIMWGKVCRWISGKVSHDTNIGYFMGWFHGMILRDDFMGWFHGMISWYQQGLIYKSQGTDSLPTPPSCQSGPQQWCYGPLLGPADWVPCSVNGETRDSVTMWSSEGLLFLMSCIWCWRSRCTT